MKTIEEEKMTELIVQEQNEKNTMKNEKFITKDADDVKKVEYKLELVWRNIILMLFVHVSAVYGIYVGLYYAHPMTILFSAILAYASSLGVQVGAHRYWCHRTFKATLPLQLIMAFAFILSLENDIYEWSRDHRVHHKYSETDADPHNAKRGFFFAHVGWLLCKKHPEVIEKGQTMDMSDLAKDPIVKFQRRFYVPLVLLIWGLFPTYVPHYLWGESLWNAFFMCVMFRYALTLNITWCVNSAAHLWGMKPYDKTINPVECSIRHLLAGEGFHNYHHTFPWDYSASEFGPLDVFNPATAFIELFAKIGWAYDLRKASTEVVKARQKRNGDPSFQKNSAFFELSTGILTHTSLFLPFFVGYFLRRPVTL